MIEPDNDNHDGKHPGPGGGDGPDLPRDPEDAAADALMRRWADTVVPLPAPPYGFQRVLVRAHRRKVRRRMLAATASVLSVAVVFGGLLAGGVLPGLLRPSSNCPPATTAYAQAKGSGVNRRTEYAIGAVLATTALTAGVLAGCAGNSTGNGPSASGTEQGTFPPPSPGGNQVTLPGAPTSAASTGPATPAGTAAGTPQCQTPDMTVAVALVAGSQGMGSASLNITLTNTSGHKCTVTGFPGVALEDKNKDQQPTKVTWDPSVPKTTITLANGASASSTARFDADVPGPGEPNSGPCESASLYMLVTPPNNKTQLVAPIDGTNNAGITVCESGALNVLALIPGTTGPNQ